MKEITPAQAFAGRQANLIVTNTTREGATVTKARFTRWPEGFDPQAHGARLND